MYIRWCIYTRINIIKRGSGGHLSEHSDPGYPCVKKGEENSDASATTSVVSLQVERGGGGMVKDTTGSFSITRSRAYTDRMCLIRVCRTWAETDESGGEGGEFPDSRFQGILNAAEPIRFGEGREGGR